MGMGVLSFLALFALFHPAASYSLADIDDFFKRCPEIDCGKLGKIIAPFTNKTLPQWCAPFVVDDCDKEHQKIQLNRGGRWYEIESIHQSNTIDITDTEFQKQLNSRQCQSFKNFNFPSFNYVRFTITNNLTLFKCNHASNLTPHPNFYFNYTECNNFSIYYTYMNRTLRTPPPNCSIVQLPIKVNHSYDNIFDLLTASFSLQVYWWSECYLCQKISNGTCLYKSNEKFPCADANGKLIPIPSETSQPKRQGGPKRKLEIGLTCLAAATVIVLFIISIWYRYKRKDAPSNTLSAITSSNLSPKSDLEEDNVYFEVPIFSYTQLEEATNNFDPEKELGNGGFGSVYYGKLHDGREVAVKRLYEHDYRRFQQFMNEIKVLTRLRHKNLVSLYGCTSRRSRELLLVYEYIPNGTVADHLHGNGIHSSPLTWPIRMRIAIETASALAYLHASDIIHRDVKTNNILLDNNYHVKVADLGLSRLFPTDATHVSTAPQGTPGYVDPEYHQFYQLTNKSDVYSFGVVLIELISSMPAVDMTRHRHEINLANLAMNKIRKCAFDELIDPCLGHQSNEVVKRMITTIAELAFQCLQHDKEMRPSMDEVLEELQRTERGEYELENIEDGHNDNDVSKSVELQPSQPDCDDIALLKNIQPPSSPNSVTQKWFSDVNCVRDHM
ncbi:hypothetical protein P3X46_023004 [Hevea brasiliensis]|uniref:Protein kinase domain-containing protein n=1 Tax=Hevea brasiliensis TaxID=3981 RepID=A0ABQ9L9J3_HEVBR|nr:LEAF RUST 10 DISEASE-RESISTANCE LOCUS RECEPTOR-LIKE PROTEIN KINASE-like 1.1 isoform X2 [Hevea brasiliensis]KAJ9163325.1 hypothetical protein P3X46_023004 [Hevea brasiliensis]